MVIHELRKVKQFQLAHEHGHLFSSRFSCSQFLDQVKRELTALISAILFALVSHSRRIIALKGLIRNQ